MRNFSWPFVLLLFVGLLCGCTGDHEVSFHPPSAGGNAGRGAQLIDQYECGRCHTIPGIHDARGVFGPPLNAMSRRTYIAGQIPNNPNNLVQWILAPTSMKPKTAMPAMGLSENQARDVAAYLETLQ